MVRENTYRTANQTITDYFLSNGNNLLDLDNRFHTLFFGLPFTCSSDVKISPSRLKLCNRFPHPTKISLSKICLTPMGNGTNMMCIFCHWFLLEKQFLVKTKLGNCLASLGQNHWIISLIRCAFLLQSIFLASFPGSCSVTVDSPK